MPKVLTKRRKAARVFKAAFVGSTKEQAESVHADVGAAQAGVETAQMETFTTNRDVDFVASTLQGLGGIATPDIADVEPMSSIFGPGGDTSNSEDEDIGAGESTVSESAEAMMKGRTCYANASRFEESDAESEDRAPPAKSPHPEDTEVVDDAQDILSLGKNM